MAGINGSTGDRQRGVSGASRGADDPARHGASRGADDPARHGASRGADDPARHGDPVPHVLIVGGFLTEPFNYWPLRRRLIERDAAGVSIAPIHWPDWLAGGLVGFGPLLVRTAVAVRRASRRAGGRPILVVGHSAGGILTRLAMSPAPFRGRSAAVSEQVGTLVTMGTPHRLVELPPRIARAGVEATRFLERHTPGAFFAPRTAYLTLGSDAVTVQGAVPVHAWDRLRGLIFRSIVGETPREGGDGIVPVTTVHLPGAEQLTFHDVRHGHIGGPWYADPDVVDRWWPLAVELWRGALATRAGAPVVEGTPEAQAAAAAVTQMAVEVAAEVEAAEVENVAENVAGSGGSD